MIVVCVKCGHLASIEKKTKNKQTKLGCNKIKCAVHQIKRKKKINVLKLLSWTLI